MKAEMVNGTLEHVIHENGMLTGTVVARRPKTNQIYVLMDGAENSPHDDWYPEVSWSEIKDD